MYSKHHQPWTPPALDIHLAKNPKESRLGLGIGTEKTWYEMIFVLSVDLFEIPVNQVKDKRLRALLRKSPKYIFFKVKGV